MEAQADTTFKSISLDSIIDVFIHYKPELKMQELKDYLFEKRGSTWEGYKDRNSFDQTIQRVVETHCATKQGYNGSDIFESYDRGYYRLNNPEHWKDFWEATAPKDSTCYLFAWNPQRWEWKDLDKNIQEIQSTGSTRIRWSCQSHKSIKVGDRAFLVKLGQGIRGIIGSGHVVSEPLLLPHWSENGKEVPRVLIEFEVILDPTKDEILPMDILTLGSLAKQHWSPQASGIKIQDSVVNELEAVWFDFLSKSDVRVNPFLGSVDKKIFAEGAANQIIQTRYERNPYARIACLNFYGYSCSVCDFNFSSKYGNLGKEFIHVHHLNQIAAIGKEYNIDPIEDLRPVCPNCHAMLHKRNPPLSIDELKSLLIKSRQLIPT